jgi:CubicO group peptidase (beta-lactamase class C family)/glutamine amidotransferase-like uncharacterized protein
MTHSQIPVAKLLFLFWILVTVIGPASLLGQEPQKYAPFLSVGPPQEVGVDSKKLDDAVSILRHAVEDHEIPGAVILVARQGRVILHEALGHRDADQVDPLQKDALFRMASNSKAVTAAGILLLAQEGRVDLDARVSEYLPAFDKPTWKSVTLRHLLTHTSGCRIPSLFLKPLLTEDELPQNTSRLCAEANRFAATPLKAEPGSTYSYNNAGFNILAAVIEQVTGSYQDHLINGIYKPLGMKDSCNHESVADHNRMSTVMIRQSDGSWKAGWTPGDPPDWPFCRGSGGMVATAWDYALFCQMLLQNGTANGQQILNERWVREMTQPQSDHCPAAKNYGLGWVVREVGGTFSHTGSDGTYVWVDPQRDLIGMVLTQSQSTTIPRQAFRLLIEKACKGEEEKQNTLESHSRHDGFYKDIFMSSGKNLTSRKVLPAAESLGLAYEYYAGGDAFRQNHLLVGNDTDENGILLYPDGEPRFRMIYVNGGGATLHGKSLTKTGRNRIRTFNRSGGSYCGSCAGSFLTGRNVDQRTELRIGYLHLFPYNTRNTGIKQTPINHNIPVDSPLLRYRDFGFDQRVDGVYHNNGNWLSLDDELPKVEVLATYQFPEHRIDGEAAIWAYQANETAGRIVNIGSHPEAALEGEKLAMTEACFLYALDGNGQSKIKAVLKEGTPQLMDRGWSDQQPDRAKIGDRQYHHFAFDVTSEQPRITLALDSEANVDLHLFLSREGIALRQQAEFIDVGFGSSKKLTQVLTPGRWYVSVYCATTVRTLNDTESGFHRYVGDRSILNGAAYKIQWTAEDAPAP